MTKTVSLIVPTRNRRAKLERLLRSIDELRGNPLEEVIVIDGRSVDSTREFLREWSRAGHSFSPIVLNQDRGNGPGSARNLGMEATVSDIVAFTDDDCIPDPDWLRFLVPAVNKTHGVVGAGGRVLPTERDWISRYFAYYRILEPPPSMLYLVTANCAYSRVEAMNVGGFDGTIPTPGGEDVALSIRLRQAGWSFGYVPEALVRHEFRSDVSDFLRTFRNYGRGCRQASNRIFYGGPNG
jgi:glycosyltransferase involved in cell wall biosynthesis